MLSTTFLGNGNGFGATGVGCEKTPDRPVDGYGYHGDFCPKSGNLYLNRTVLAPKGTVGWKNLRKNVGPTVTNNFQKLTGWNESKSAIVLPVYNVMDQNSIMQRSYIPQRLNGELGIGSYDSKNDFYITLWIGDRMLDAKSLMAGDINKVTKAKIAILPDRPEKGFWSSIKEGIGDLVSSICGAVSDPKVQAAMAVALATGAVSPTGVVAGGALVTAAICAGTFSASSAPPVPTGTVKLPTGATSPSTSVQTASSKYAGGIAALDLKTGTYKIAMPTGLADFGAAPFVQVAVSTSPEGATVVTASQFEKQTGQLPWYKNPITYYIAGGVLAVGGGVALYRRRR